MLKVLGGGMTVPACLCRRHHIEPPGNRWFKVAVFIMAFGCGGLERPPTVTRVDSAGVTIVESSAPLWRPHDGWRVNGPTTVVGTIDGPPENQLYRVRGATRLADGNIVVANGGSSEIRIYGREGRWIRSLGGDGDGPGEFRRIRGLQRLAADTLLVTDFRGPRVTLFTASGTLVGDRRLASQLSAFNPPNHRLHDGRWLDLVPSREVEGYQRRLNTFVAWSDSSGATDSILGFDGAEYLIYFRHRGDEYIGRGAIVVPFGGQDLTAVGPERVALSDGQAFDIAVSEIGGRQFRVRRTIERQRTTREDVGRFVDDYVSRYPQARQREVRDHFGSVSPSPLVPTHSAVAFDLSGNLWVENYRLPWNGEFPRIWSVFGAEGLWLGDVEVPHGLRIYEIGDDYIVGIERDEMDVEYVTLYEILKP